MSLHSPRSPDPSVYPSFHLSLSTTLLPTPLPLIAPLIPVAGNAQWGAFFTNNGQKKNTQALAIATGCFAGATESVVVTPFELVKIKLQDKKTTFKGPLEVIKHTMKTSGPLG